MPATPLVGETVWVGPNIDMPVQLLVGALKDADAGSSAVRS
jgi:hypothetical protein